MKLEKRIQNAEKNNEYEELRKLLELQNFIENMGSVLSFDTQVDPFTGLETVTLIAETESEE